MRSTDLFWLGDRVNCRMPQLERNRRVAFGRQQVAEAVLRTTNLFKEFILKIISSEFKRFNLAVGKSSIIWFGCKIMRWARFWRASNRSLCAVVRLWCHTTQPYSTTERMTHLRKQSKSLDKSPERFSILKKYSLDATCAHKASTCASQRISSEILIPSNLKHFTVLITLRLTQSDDGGFFEHCQETFLWVFFRNWCSCCYFLTKVPGN